MVRQSSLRTAMAAGVAVCLCGTASGQYVELQPSGGGLAEAFGHSVGLRGDVLVVGAAFADDMGVDAGAAYMFEFADAQWSQTARVTASDAGASDRFGYSVWVDGDLAVVGAPHSQQPAATGKAHVFQRTRGTWSEVARLVGSDSRPEDFFGESVAISGGTVLVGAPWADGPGDWSGSAYVFEQVGGVWSQTAKLKSSDIGNVDKFGSAVAIEGDVALIGAPQKPRGGTVDVGCVYVFERIGGVWVETAKLFGDAPDGNSKYFGDAVALDGDRAVVGATREDGHAWSSGAAHIFERDAGSWVEVAKVYAPDGQSYDHFGGSVAVGGDLVLVGAPWDADFGSFSGSAYLFERQPDGVWTLVQKFNSPYGEASDVMGGSVLIDGEALVISCSGAAEAGAVFLTSPPADRTPDFNGDGVIDTRDVLDFLGAWNQHDISADWDGNWWVDTRDVLAFLNDWVAG